MNISKSEKMNVLLRQLQIPQDIIDVYFQHSMLEKVHVHKKVEIMAFLHSGGKSFAS